MELSVVIPCHNGAEDTRACLESLADQQGAPPFEVLVVDNGSSDGTAGLAEGHAFARTVALPDNRGFAGGANAGLAAARGRLLMVLNNDTMAAPHLLARLVAPLRDRPDVAITGPTSNCVKGAARLEVGDHGLAAAGRREIEEVLAERWAGAVEDTEDLSGLCMTFRRSWLDRVGGFDERFGPGNFEDDDLCLRTRLRGGRLVIVRDAFLHHHGHRTFTSLGLDFRAELAARWEQLEAKWRDDEGARSWLLWKSGRWQEAAAAAPVSLRHYPDWPDPLRYLGAAAAEAGRYEEAAAWFARYLERCPMDPDVIARRAVALVHAGLDGEARGLLAHALGHCPFDDRAGAALFAQLGHARLGRNEPDAALQHLADALALRPGDGELLNARGAALLALERWADAAEAFADALEAGCARARSNLGVARWRLGDPVAARRLWTEALAADPGDREAAANLAAGGG